MPPFPQAEGRDRGRGGARQAAERRSTPSFGPAVAAASIAQVHRAEIDDGRRPQAGRREGAAPGRRAALPRRRSTPSASWRNCGEAFLGGGAAAAPDRDRQHAAPLGRDRDGSAARSRRAVRDGGEHQGRSGFPRARRRLGPHRQGRADAGMDRRHAAQRPRPARSAGPRPEKARRGGDPDLPAPCAARRLFPRRHASRQSVRRRRGQAHRRRFRHHGPARPQGAALPRRDPLRLHHPQLSPHRRGAFRGGLCAVASIRSTISRRRSAPSASRSTTAPPKTSRWRSF